MKHLALASLAAAGLALSSPAFSQTPTREPAANTMHRAAAISAAGEFVTVPRRDELSSKAVGLDVYNKANQDIGTIKDVAIADNDVQAYIIGVGGFLGAGEHYVAVKPSALTLTYNSTDKKWRAEMNATKADLKAAPEFKYPSTM